jgi:methionyl-tRNA formyltransferase
MFPRIVFMGSPGFAVPSLQALASHYPPVGVVTQPDQPAGRGRILTPPPVKILAEELGIPVIQPKRLREPGAMEQLADWQPDLIVVAAFGQILRPDVLGLPSLGCINVHASLLPRWRGAAPIQAAILHGDQQTGITIMKMDAGVDTGPILSQRNINIQPDDTAGILAERLAETGAQLLIDTLPGYLNGAIRPQAQEDAQATYAPMLSKLDGLLDFTQAAQVLKRKVHAFNPWPGAFTYINAEIFKIHRASALEAGLKNFSAEEIGRRTRWNGMPAIVCGDARLLILDLVQPAGKKAVAGKVYLQGARNWDELR